MFFNQPKKTTHPSKYQGNLCYREIFIMQKIKEKDKVDYRSGK